MRRAPTRSDCLGASPRRVLHANPLRLDLSRSLSQQQYLHDWQAIRQMFANGELGGYWEPSPDTLRTITYNQFYDLAVGGVAGCWRDRLIGTNPVEVTVANGEFDTNLTNWAKGSSVPEMVWDAGELRFIGAGQPGGGGGSWIYPIYTSGPTGASLFGRCVKVICDLTWVSGGDFYIAPTGYSEARRIRAIDNGGLKKTYEFAGCSVFDSASNRICVFGADAGAVWKIDNVRIYMCGGSVATQSTTGNKPYLRQTPTTKRYWLDGNAATANLTATFPSSLGSSCTIATLDPEFGVIWKEAQTISTTYNLITPYAYHGPQFIINRALTASEKAIVARVMLRQMPGLGPNLIDNGDMEFGLPPGATCANPAEQICVRVTNEPKFGTAALALVKTTSNAAQPSVIFPVPASIRDKQVLAFVRSYATQSNATGYYVSSEPASGSAVFSTNIVANQTWRTIRGFGVMPTNATGLRHSIGTFPSYEAGTEVFRLDDVVFREIL